MKKSNDNLNIIALVRQCQLDVLHQHIEDFCFKEKMKVYYQKQCYLFGEYLQMLKSYDEPKLKWLIEQWDYFNMKNSDRVTFYEYAFSSIRHICGFKPVGHQEECKYCILNNVVYPYFTADYPYHGWCKKSPHWWHTLEALAISLNVDNKGNYGFYLVNNNMTGNSFKEYYDYSNDNVTIATWMKLMMIEINRAILIIENSINLHLLKEQEEK